MNKKVWALVAALCLSVVSLTVFAATEHWNDASATPYVHMSTEFSPFTGFQTWKKNWDDIKTDFEQISLTPGQDETELNFGWYSKEPDSAKIRIFTKSSSSSASEPKEFEGTFKEGTLIDGIQYYTNKVTVTGLEPDTTCYYQYLLNGEWQKRARLDTQDPESFSVLYVGDPQIGASVKQTPKNGDGEAQSAEIAARNDSFNWNVALSQAMAAHPDVSFLLSAGDQINQYADDGKPESLLQQEYEYSGYLSPKTLKSLPVATTIGNHDSQTTGYQNHFNNPNPFTEEKSPTPAGNGYYYSYGNALFIIINTNNYNAADHKALLDKATKAYPDKKWRILMFHQDIFGSGQDHSDSDGIILRTQLTPIIDEYNIDVVLQGHDHTYSRTYQLTGDAKAHKAYDDTVNLKDPAAKAEFLKENQNYRIAETRQGSVTNPEGTVYMEANSASGSKFYELISPQQDYIAARSQTWTPTYSVIDIDSDSFTINTYETANGNPIDEPYTIIKD